MKSCLGFFWGERVEWMSVCVTRWKQSSCSLSASPLSYLPSLFLSHTPLSPRQPSKQHPSCMCLWNVDHQTKGGWHLQLSNVNIPASSLSYLSLRRFSLHLKMMTGGDIDIFTSMWAYEYLLAKYGEKPICFWINYYLLTILSILISPNITGTDIKSTC